VAVLVESEPLFAVAFDAPGETMRCATWADVRALFAGADDVMDFPDTTHEAAVEELDLAWARDRALQLTLVLLDRDAKADTRAEAADCVGELFAEPISGRTGQVEVFVANRLLLCSTPRGFIRPVGGNHPSPRRPIRQAPSPCSCARSRRPNRASRYSAARGMTSRSVCSVEAGKVLRPRRRFIVKKHERSLC
jgi:hypothetical protein